MILHHLLRQKRCIIPLVLVGFITFFYTTTITKFLPAFGGQAKDVEICRVKYIDPFSNEVMKHIRHVHEQKCAREERVQVSITNSNISLSATDLNLVRMRQITDDDAKAGYRLGEFVHLVDPLFKKKLAFSTGALQNLESKLCIVPVKYDREAPPNEIGLILSSDCENEDAIFTHTQDRFIIHKQTAKCFRPLGGAKKPAKDTRLVLSSHCQSKFGVINDGVWQLIGSPSCVHPLWGKAAKGKKLCLYPECNYNSRLIFHWFNKVEGNEGKKHVTTNKQYQLTADMCHVQVQLLSEEVIDIYVLACVPRPTPTIKSFSPNIVIICIEEASAAHFKRKLPDASLAMTKMGFTEYKMHSAISESPVINLLATLNGMKGEEGTEVPIFKLAKTNNYISMVTADDPSRLDRMKNSLEVQHSSLPFFRVLKREYKLEGLDYCVNGQPMHDLTFNYLLSFLNSYPDHAKLAVTVLSVLCRSNFNDLGYLSYLDKHMTKLLDYVKDMKNTVILIQSIKGGQTPMLRQVQQIVDEIKRPLLATFVSKDIRNKYKFEETRADQLSTPFDIHVTLRQLITSQEEQSHRYGRSLFKKVNSRNCQQASVYPHMCPCIQIGRSTNDTQPV